MSKLKFIERFALVLATVFATWTALLFITGGFDLAWGGIRISAHDAKRPLFVAAVAATIYILAGGPIAVPAWIASPRRVVVSSPVFAWLRAIRPRSLALALAVATTVIAWVWGAKAVGAADSYGYLSQSDLWAEGSIIVRQPFAADVPWPNAIWSFSPVGSYRPMSHWRRVHGEDRWSIVPVYPPGLPLILAAAGVFGIQAKFTVFAVLAGVLVLATYGIGVRLATERMGLIGAWLVATSPAVVFMMMSPMSDVPVSGLLAAAFYFLFGRGIASAAGAGLLVGAAVLTRPNLAPLVGVMGLIYVSRLREPGSRVRALVEGIAFTVPAAIGVIVLGAINHHIYGSPTASGYGNVGSLFSFSHIPQNLRQYLGWLNETQTPLALAGLAAALVPLKRFWPEAGRDTRVVMALSVAVVWCTYLLYAPWDAWWYLRFLLPAAPFVALGTGAVLAFVTRNSAARHWPVVIVVLGLGAFQIAIAHSRGAFDMWHLERRYVASARMTNQFTDRNSLIFTGVHVGNVRYYGSRMSLYFESFPREWLDRSVRWLSRRGVHPYLLIEEWEIPIFQERFAGEQLVSVVDRVPIAVFENPSRILLFDLAEDARPIEAPALWSGVDDSVWAAPRAPEPRFAIEDPRRSRPDR